MKFADLGLNPRTLLTDFPRLLLNLGFFALLCCVNDPNNDGSTVTGRCSCRCRLLSHL